MKIEVVRAGPEQQPVIEHLFQFYHYDWTEIAREGEETYSNVGENGLFDVESLARFWNEPKRHPFLLKVDGTLAGFALVRQQSYLSGDPETNDMVEFFVMRKFRRKGVGREMATRLFTMFPGRWEVREVAENANAQAFWRAVIGGYTGGAYEETWVENEKWTGPVQSFLRSGAKE